MPANSGSPARGCGDFPSWLCMSGLLRAVPRDLGFVSLQVSGRTRPYCRLANSRKRLDGNAPELSRYSQSQGLLGKSELLCLHACPDATTNRIREQRKMGFKRDPQAMNGGSGLSSSAEQLPRTAFTHRRCLTWGFVARMTAFHLRLARQHADNGEIIKRCSLGRVIRHQQPGGGTFSPGRISHTKIFDASGPNSLLLLRHIDSRVSQPGLGCRATSVGSPCQFPIIQTSTIRPTGASETGAVT